MASPIYSTTPCPVCSTVSSTACPNSPSELTTACPVCPDVSTTACPVITNPACPTYSPSTYFSMAVFNFFIATLDSSDQNDDCDLFKTLTYVFAGLTAMFLITTIVFFMLWCKSNKGGKENKIL